MASNISEIDALVVPRIKESDNRLSLDDRFKAIASARREYERVFPLEKVKQLDGAGAFDFTIDNTNFPGFVVGFSSITQVYFPYAATDQQPVRLDVDRYEVRQLPSGWVFRMRFDTPTAAQKLLVYWTAQHTVSASACTIPASDDDAFADLAASFCFLMLAATYAQVVDGTIDADSADRRSRVDYYKGLAKVLRESYERKLGLGDEAAQAAGLAVADLNPPFSSRTRERLLFHD